MSSPGQHLDRDGVHRPWVGVALAEHLLLGGRQRDQDDVVLVLAPRVLALAIQQADHRERDLLDPDDLAERVGVAEQVEGRGLAQQRHLGGAIDVLGADGSPGQHDPVARLEVVAGDALDAGGPVEVAEHDLSVTPHRGGGHLNGRDLAGDGGRVVLGDRELRALPDAHPARRHRARQHDDEVGAQALDLLGHPGGGAGPDRHHGDDRADADDDAEHGERAPQLVHAQ